MSTPSPRACAASTASITWSGSTPTREVDDCRGPSGRVEPERLAARFAAKEAAIKALPGAGEGVRLTTIEVVSGADGQVRLELSGRAAELASEAGVEEIALSITHEAGIAAATVVMA